MPPFTRLPIPSPGQGWFPGLSMMEYLSLDAWSKGSIVDIATGWPAARVRHDADLEPTPDGGGTEATEFGTAVHLALSDLDAFSARYAPVPDGDGRSKAIKDAVKAVEDSGRLPLRQSKYDGCRRIVRQVFAHPVLGPCLEDPDSVLESTGVWEHPDLDGLMLRCRPDVRNTKRGLILDWKTCLDPRTDAFMRNAWPDYCVGAVHYTEAGAELENGAKHDFVLVAIQSQPPYLINPIILDDDTLEAARSIWNRGCEALHACIESNVWPVFRGADGTGVAVGRAPQWALNQENQR